MRGDPPEVNPPMRHASARAASRRISGRPDTQRAAGLRQDLLCANRRPALQYVEQQYDVSRVFHSNDAISKRTRDDQAHPPGPRGSCSHRNPAEQGAPVGNFASQCAARRSRIPVE
jgi:hypothetical protein